MRKRSFLFVLVLAAMSATVLTPATRRGVVGAVTAAIEVPFRASIMPGQRSVHIVNVGMADDELWVRGTTGADIDCFLYDADGDRVDEDTDSTDTCLLATPGIGLHRLVVRNLSRSYANTYTVRRD